MVAKDTKNYSKVKTILREYLSAGKPVNKILLSNCKTSHL